MSTSKILGLCALGMAVGLASQAAWANSLNVSYVFNGKGNWSLDAVGSNNTPVGTIQAVVPAGSTVVQAYLYSSRTPWTAGAPTIDFDGTVYGPASFVSLGINVAGLGLEAFRADVTAQVAAKIGGGGGGAFNFSVNSESENGDRDGEALVIIYSNPAEVTRTIAILDGSSSSTGDSALFTFASPVDPTVSGFEALMSLGIGYSYQFGGVQQYSKVDVNGSRLTTSAGGEDDGISQNGGLITIGGIGDSTANPANPFATPTNPLSDDELYDVKGFISIGDTTFTINTLNPSNDDNIFFLGLNVTAEGTVINPDVIPEPLTMLGLCLGVGAVGGYIRRRLAA